MPSSLCSWDTLRKFVVHVAWSAALATAFIRAAAVLAQTPDAVDARGDNAVWRDSIAPTRADTAQRKRDTTSTVSDAVTDVSTASSTPGARDSTSSRRVRYGLLGGWTFPSGGTADYYGSGWNAGAFLEQSYGNKPIGLRVYVTYNRLPSKDEESRPVEAGGIDGNVVLQSPTGAVRPYLTGGAGLSWVKTSDSELQFAFNVGAGVRLDTQSFGSFVEVRYLRIGLEGIALVPLAIGFVFGGR